MKKVCPASQAVAALQGPAFETRESMNMASGVNVSACYPVKQMVRMHEGCRLCMTCRPEIWTRQIDDTTLPS